MATLGEIVAQLHTWYPPSRAESWDAVGLVHGDPEAEIRKVMFAVDPTEAVAAEAVEWGADLLVVHHPLFLTPVHGFAATTPKGRTLHALAKAGCALLTAHTNADVAVDGVSDALARALGLEDLQPLVPLVPEPLDKLVVYIPRDATAIVRAAVAEAGAGMIGNYDHCSFTSPGEGRFRPLEGSEPAIGLIGEIAVVDEERLEVVYPRAIRSAVVTAMKLAHPYEEPAYDVVELADPGLSSIGTGRRGIVPVETLEEFVTRVARALPATAGGIRVAGDLTREVRRVAVCGGAGDFLLDRLAGTDLDVYLTSDLRHHRAAEFVEAGGPALIDVAHWAAEWTWLPVVQAKLTEALGDTVETRVSTLCTDPWTSRT